MTTKVIIEVFDANFEEQMKKVNVEVFNQHANVRCIE
jgi:hypothetical protein